MIDNMNLLAPLLCRDYLSCHLAIKSEGSPQSSFADSLRPVNFVSQHQHRHIGDRLVSEEGLKHEAERERLGQSAIWDTAARKPHQWAALLSSHSNIQVHGVIF